MSRIRCSPCEIVLPVCDCCREELCFCSKNSIELSCAPCICNPRGPYLGQGVPMLVEGWVPDDQFTTNYKNHTLPGPQLSSFATCEATYRGTINWDAPTTLFSYDSSDFAESENIHHMGDLGAGFTQGSFGIYPGFNDHIGDRVNTIVNKLITKDFVTTYNLPYNSQLFYMMKNRVNLVNDSLSLQASSFLEALNHKSPSTYNFGRKYLNQLTKSILVGKLDTYFPSDKMSHILSSSEELYEDRSVPELSETLLTNLENAKEYIEAHRQSISPRVVDGHRNQSFPENTLRKFWKVIPSDTDQRVRVYRAPQIVNILPQPVPPYGLGTHNVPVVTAHNTSPSSIMSVKVNDDDTITVYRQNRIVGGYLTTFSPARVHYINAEVLRVYNTAYHYNEFNHKISYLDPTPRYQGGCECVSGCHVKICSDRDRAYVFDPQDRAVLLGLLGSVSGDRFSWSPDEPYLDLTISSPLNNAEGAWNEIEFDPPSEYLSPAELTASPDYGYYNSDPTWHDFYLLTPQLSGVDLVDSIIPEGTNPEEDEELSGAHTNPYIRKTEIPYRVRASEYNYSTKNTFDYWMGFKSGPGNVFYVDHNDPIVKYLNRAHLTCQDVSATMVDLNIDNILDEGEVYPRRVPYHIVIIPTDSNQKWNPFASKSKITRMIDPTDSTNFDHEFDAGYIQRTLRMIPSPRLDVLDSNYLELASIDASKYYGLAGRVGPPYLAGRCTPWVALHVDKWESRNYPNGAEGIENDPKRMAWKARSIADLGPSWVLSGVPTSSIQTVFRTFEQEGYEIPNSRVTDPVKRVFDWLMKARYAYETRTDITYQAGLVPASIVYHQYHPVTNNNSLPKFDLWRHLTMFEFHEFLLSFNNEFFSTVPQLYQGGPAGGLAWGRFRDLQLFDSLNIFPEKTYLNTYAPQYTRAWHNKFASSFFGSYTGNQYNLRNAILAPEMEEPRNSLNDNGVIMDEKDPQGYY